MPNPKKHHTHARTRMRRGQWILSSPEIIRCPQCGEYKLSHKICPNCGYYKGKVWISKKEKSTKGENVEK
ncbi:MAG: 50S ribosomal protein L32 [Endomicrobia bacterium]|nr:50S ribosomal protein L32 [Endomicrobiia bacterium]